MANDDASARDAPGIAAKAVEASLEPIIRDIPEPKKSEIVRVFEQNTMAVFRSVGGPPIDPETAKILAETTQRDNDNKFKYLSQKQADTAAREERQHHLATAQHKDLVKPIVWAVVLTTVASVAAGIAFIAFGKEAVGSSILTGIFGALLGYLGGLGTAGHFQRKPN